MLGTCTNTGFQPRAAEASNFSEKMFCISAHCRKWILNDYISLASPCARPPGVSSLVVNRNWGHKSKDPSGTESHDSMT